MFLQCYTPESITQHPSTHIEPKHFVQTRTAYMYWEGQGQGGSETVFCDRFPPKGKDSVGAWKAAAPKVQAYIFFGMNRLAVSHFDWRLLASVTLHLTFAKQRTQWLNQMRSDVAAQQLTSAKAGYDLAGLIDDLMRTEAV
eukprot:1151112-Pelagomonas_calceolata.AAC.1